jgi:hypothetical protein
MDLLVREICYGLYSSERINWGDPGKLTSALRVAMEESNCEIDSLKSSIHYRVADQLKHGN